NYKLENDDKNPKQILWAMRNHEGSKILFTSLAGFFYQHGVGGVTDRKMSLELYILAVNNEHSLNKLHLIEENKDEFSSLRNNNIVIGKYLLSLYYYKDIILDKGLLYNQEEIKTNDNNEDQNELIKLTKNGDPDDGMKIRNDEYKEFDLGSMSEKNKRLVTKNKISVDKFAKEGFIAD